MSESRREFLERYRFADFALKVVGVGSVGTRCFVMVLEGCDEDDPLILQAKEATASVLEDHLGASGYANHGERVVVGQRVMQATPDIFLGWTRGPVGRDFYVRQLWDMKGSVDTSMLRPEGLGFYGGLCAWALARAHARSGDSVAISAYLGTSDTFDGAIADFAETYADQNATGPSRLRRGHRGGAGVARRDDCVVIDVPLVGRPAGIRDALRPNHPTRSDTVPAGPGSTATPSHRDIDRTHRRRRG